MRVQCDTFLKHPGPCADWRKLLPLFQLPQIQAKVLPVQEASQPPRRARAPSTLRAPLCITRKRHLFLRESSISTPLSFGLSLHAEPYLPESPQQPCPGVHTSAGKLLCFSKPSWAFDQNQKSLCKLSKTPAPTPSQTREALEEFHGAAWGLCRPGWLGVPLLLLWLSSLLLLFSLILQG